MKSKTKTKIPPRKNLPQVSYDQSPYRPIYDGHHKIVEWRDFSQTRTVVISKSDGKKKSPPPRKVEQIPKSHDSKYYESSAASFCKVAVDDFDLKDGQARLKVGDVVEYEGDEYVVEHLDVAAHMARFCRLKDGFHQFCESSAVDPRVVKRRIEDFQPGNIRASAGTKKQTGPTERKKNMEKKSAIMDKKGKSSSRGLAAYVKEQALKGTKPSVILKKTLELWPTSNRSNPANINGIIELSLKWAAGGGEKKVRATPEAPEKKMIKKSTPPPPKKKAGKSAPPPPVKKAPVAKKAGPPPRPVVNTEDEVQENEQATHEGEGEGDGEAQE